MEFQISAYALACYIKTALMQQFAIVDCPEGLADEHEIVQVIEAALNNCQSINCIGQLKTPPGTGS